MGVMIKPTREEIEEKVRDVLVDSLEIKREEAKDDARIIDDLGAESIDYLDIIFRLERKFGIRIPQDVGSLFPVHWEGNGRAEYFEGERFTGEGLRAFGKDYPHFDLRGLETPTKEEIDGRITVRSVVKYIDGNWGGITKWLKK